MKVILKQDHASLGKTGEMVSVKDGFAMNYLIPNHIAMKVSEGNIRTYEELKKQRSKKIAKEISDTQQLADEIGKFTLEIKMKAGEDGKTYGSVNAHVISDSLETHGFKVDKKNIILEEPIRELGIFTVDIKFNNDIKTILKVSVIPDEPAHQTK